MPDRTIIKGRDVSSLGSDFNTAISALSVVDQEILDLVMADFQTAIDADDQFLEDSYAVMVKLDELGRSYFGEIDENNHIEYHAFFNTLREQYYAWVRAGRMANEEDRITDLPADTCMLGRYKSAGVHPRWGESMENAESPREPEE